MKHITITLMISASLVLAQDEKAKEEIKELDPIVVESSPLQPDASAVTQAWTVLKGNELDRARANTIGDSLGLLANEPGLTQSFFGPSASRPIIRGLDKYRVRMLQNGVDTFGVSSSSEDHAVPIDPLMIERIEVLRGSSALLYGGNAIGGVINVIDRNIPTQAYSGFSGGSFTSNYSSINKGWSAGVNAYGGSDSLSFQINGLEKEYWDYDSPSGKIKNSMGDRSIFGFGASHIMKNGYAGFSFSQYENSYNIPGGEHAEKKSRIEMENDRFEVRSEIEIADSDWLKSIELHLGFGDYEHSEIGLEDGEEGFHTHSTYLREGGEGRLLLLHEVGQFSGALGFYGFLGDFKIDGEESIFAGSTTGRQLELEESTKLAVFLIEQFDLNEDTQLNGGLRLENLDRDFTGTDISDRDDSTFSASGGFSRTLNEQWTLSGNLNYSERTPDSAELFSDGAHHATHSYEIGDPNLDTESAVGGELILRGNVGKVTGQLTAYQTNFKNYVFLEDTEDTQAVEGENLPVKRFKDATAEFRGLEAELDWLAMENPGWSLILSGFGDLVRAKNETEKTHLPRIPPARLGVGFEIQADKLTFGMNLTRAFKQDRIPVHAEEEEEEEEGHEHSEPTATAAYSLLNAYASYDVEVLDSEGKLFLRGFNLTDETARLHTSFLKDQAPLPGAGVEVGFRIDF